MTKDEATKVVESVIEAFQCVAESPDGDLNTEDAWRMSACYMAEFTMRQLFFNGLIHRHEASPAFTATGGDHGDIEAWTLKIKPTACPLCSGPVSKDIDCEVCGIFFCPECERWRGWKLGAHDNKPEVCDHCWMPDPPKGV